MIKDNVLKNLFLFLIMLAFIYGCFASPHHMKPNPIHQKLAALEVLYGGRIGFNAINTGDNSFLQYHQKERFPMCSTSKITAVSAILTLGTTDTNLLHHHITHTKKDVDSAGYAPITKKSMCKHETSAQYS